MTEKERNERLKKLIQLAEEIGERRQQMEILHNSLVDDNEWKKAFLQFEQVREIINDLLCNILIKETKHDIQ